MNEKIKLVFGIFILLCLGLIGAMEVSIYVNSIDVIERPHEPVNINGNLYVLDPYWWNVSEPQYYLNSTQVHEIAEEDIHGNPIFWIDDIEDKKIWILLPNSTGHMMAYVEDIDNLIETSNYTFTDVYVRKLEYSNYTESNDNIFINNTDVYMEVSPHTTTEKKTTEDILLECNFSNWSVEDQRLLANMMRVTAQQRSGISDASEFSSLVDDAPVHVLEAYITLLENIGY